MILLKTIDYFYEMLIKAYLPNNTQTTILYFKEFLCKKF